MKNEIGEKYCFYRPIQVFYQPLLYYVSQKLVPILYTKLAYMLSIF